MFTKDNIMEFILTLDWRFLIHACKWIVLVVAATSPLWVGYLFNNLCGR